MKTLLGRLCKSFGFTRFGGVALDDGHGIQNFGGNAAAVGHAVLAGARQAPHTPAVQSGGPYHQHDRQDQLQHHGGMGPDQHGQCTCAHDRVSQPHRKRTAHHRLNQGGVCHQSTDHFARGRGFKKCGTLF